MWKLKEDTRMSVNLMVPKRKLAYSLSIKNKHRSKVELKVDWVSDEEINRGV
jgi:hypothetical protein